MAVLAFPDPRRADGDIVAMGGDLDVETLRLAYAQGIFPWPHDGYPLLWFCPVERAILEFDRLHIPASLAKAGRRGEYTFTIDGNFAGVIAACQSTPRPGQDGTWITPAVREAYTRLHHAGHAHSAEAWSRDGELVGGVYGVDGGGVFSGESMFHHAPNASKLALLHLVDHLRGRGLAFMDIQQLTPHMARLGAYCLPRDEFLDRWAVAKAQKRELF